MMSRKQIGGDFYHLYLHWPREPMVHTLSSSSPNPSASIPFAPRQCTANQANSKPPIKHTYSTPTFRFPDTPFSQAAAPFKVPKSFVNPSCARTLPHLPSPACPPSSSSPSPSLPRRSRQTDQFVIQPIIQIILRTHPIRIPSFPSFLTAPLRPRVAFYARAEQKTVRACVRACTAWACTKR